jgi:hypothetical protein
MESKNRQQFEGSSDITFKVTLKSWPSYYVVLLTENDSQESVEISEQTPQLMVINRLYASTIGRIQDSEMYETVAYLTGTTGTFERSIMFKRKEPIQWEVGNKGIDHDSK